MKTTLLLFLAAAALLLASALPLTAQVPQIINYQGKLTVSGAPFTGTGQFKFALVSGDGTSTYWSHDGTSTEGSEPTAALALPVVNGLYVVPLGDTSLPGMAAVPPSVFENTDVRLRVWCDDGSNGSAQLAPDQRITSVGYAMVAATVADGAVTSEKLAENLTLTGTMTAGNLAGNGSQITHLNTGSTFIRWGNATAPAGTQLLYSGLGFMNYYSHAGSIAPIVIKEGDLGGALPPPSMGTLYPMSISNQSLPSGIQGNCLLKAAVCYVDKPTTTIWGTWTPPDGWVVVYKGYAMSGHFSHSGSSGPICVDADAFDASVPASTATYPTLIYSSHVATPITGYSYGYQPGSPVSLKCAVIMKAP